MAVRTITTIMVAIVLNIQLVTFFNKMKPMIMATIQNI